MDQRESHRMRQAMTWRPPVVTDTDRLHQDLQRVSDQMHDDAVQSLIAARIRLKRARAAVGTGDAITGAIASDLDFIERRVEYALRAVRSMGVGALPPGPPCEDVIGAITAAVDTVRDRFDLQVVATCTGHSRTPTSAAPIVHRIVLEALSNVAIHARTRFASIDASVGTEIHVSIQDLGCGFPRATQIDDASTWDLGGDGLRQAAYIAHRNGGRLSIYSTPTKGTSVQLRLPLTHLAS